MNEQNSITDSQDNTNGSTSKANPLKKLVKKVVFLDLNNSYELFKALKECLSLIEAKIADCLSKEVDYLITSKASTSTINDTNNKRFKTSPKTQMNFMHSKTLINRTHSILERASKANISTSIDAVSTATRLGIKVINVSELEPYLQKFNRKSANHTNDINSNKHEASKRVSLENKKTNILKLKSPFIKFESICKQYKPVYCEFKVWHDIDFESIAKNTCSPFQNFFSDESNKNSSVESHSNPTPSNNNPTTQSNLAPSTSVTTLNNINKTSKSNLADGITRKTSNSILVKKETKKKTGYCECCKQRYENLKQHITSVQHENFEKNSDNFKEIDQLINNELNFENYLIKKNLKNETKKIEANEIIEKEDHINKKIEETVPAFDQIIEPSNAENQDNKIKEFQNINNTNSSLVKEINTQESNIIIQRFDNQMFEITNTHFKSRTDEFDQQLDVSPIKKTVAISASSLINQLMKSPLLDEENMNSNLIKKMSPAKLSSYQSPLSRVIVNNYEESSSFNCIDDVVLAAFINDFSYELVENQSLNQNR